VLCQKGSVFSYILFEHREKEEKGNKKNDAFSLILFSTTIYNYSD